MKRLRGAIGPLRARRIERLVELLTDSEPMPAKLVARTMGISLDTALVHLRAASRSGAVVTVFAGPRSVWTVPAREAAARQAVEAQRSALYLRRLEAMRRRAAQAAAAQRVEAGIARGPASVWDLGA